MNTKRKGKIGPSLNDLYKLMIFKFVRWHRCDTTATSSQPVRSHVGEADDEPSIMVCGLWNCLEQVFEGLRYYRGPGKNIFAKIAANNRRNISDDSDAYC